jgi:photosystem II stability/assembly factor-like uncharacterized protein
LFIAAAAGLGLPVVAAAAPGSGAPPGFLPSSTSWTSERNGWVLGFAPCAQGDCANLLRTLDGGQTWLRWPAPPVRQTPEHDQVRVWFANDVDGLATDGHRLFASHSAGVRWQQVPLPEAEIGAVASNDRFMYAILSDGAGTRLYSSPLHASRWAPVPGIELPTAGGGDVVARGTSAFVALASVFQSNGYWSTTDGRDWRASAPPCDVNSVPNLGLARDRALFALCSHDPGRGFMAKDLERAEPDGSFSFVSTAPPVGITTGFDAASRSTVAAAAVGAGAAFVHRGTAGGTTWDTPFVGDEQPVFDLAFTDSRHGTMVLGGPGWPNAVVYRTTDAGATWTPLTL